MSRPYSAPPPLARLLRLLTGALLLPWCAGAALALGRLALRSPGGEDFWIAAGGGAGSAILLLALLPKPWWLYVAGHELTHALWALAFGAKVQSMRVRSQGGEVRVSKRNFLIVLAPYFFPFYSVLWSAAAVGARQVWPELLAPAWIHFGLGATFAFHLVLTVVVLRREQPDIESEGRVFSAGVIFLGNAAAFAVVIAAAAGQWGELARWGAETADDTGWLINRMLTALRP